MPTHYHGTPQEELALNTFIKLTRANSMLESRLADRCTMQDLTTSQFGVLEVLFHLGPMCQNAIGMKLLKSGGNMSLVIENLEKRSLIHRERDPEDRRRLIVSLTDTGRRMISEIFPGHVAAITSELSVLSPQEQETLGALCRKLGTSGG
ncbi:MAG: MarR family winged helix-turn-helix transcriptional regulator [Anaerolineales bacterium]|jgi:MarR family 2-MHQ and catechol resistance regulon transcriptional repressor